MTLGRMWMIGLECALFCAALLVSAAARQPAIALVAAPIGALALYDILR